MTTGSFQKSYMKHLLCTRPELKAGYKTKLLVFRNLGPGEEGQKQQSPRPQPEGCILCRCGVEGTRLSQQKTSEGNLGKGTGL